MASLGLSNSQPCQRRRSSTCADEGRRASVRCAACAGHVCLAAAIGGTCVHALPTSLARTSINGLTQWSAESVLRAKAICTICNLFPSSQRSTWQPCWAEAPGKIARMTLTIKLDRNWSSFQLANSAPPLSVTGSAIAPSARMCCTPPLKMVAWQAPRPARPSRAQWLCTKGKSLMGGVHV